MVNMWKWPLTAEKKDVRSLLDELFGEEPATGVYIKRPEVEDSISSHLNIGDSLFLIYGPSGVGKTSVTRKLMRTRFPKAFEVECSSRMSFSEIVSEIRSQAFWPGSSIGEKAWASAASVAKLLSVFQGSGGNIDVPRVTANERTFVLRLLSRSGMAVLLEKAESLSPIVLSELMEFLNCGYEGDLRRGGRARIVVIYAGESPLSPPKGQVQRFHAERVKPMTPIEIESILDSGEKRLNIAFGQPARRVVVDSSVGNPAACKHIVRRTLAARKESFDVPCSIRNEIGAQELRCAVDNIAAEQEKSLIGDWMVFLADRNSIDSIALHKIAELGRHKVQISAIAAACGPHRKGNRTIDVLPTLKHLAMHYLEHEHTSAFRIDDDELEFVRPFLLEALRSYFKIH